MANLIQRIKAHNTGRAKTGVTKLALTCEAAAHMRDSGDWTPLALLMGGACGNERSRMGKLITALTGCKVVSDAKQPSGYRVKGKFDTQYMGEGNMHTDSIAIALMYVEANVPFGSKALEEGYEHIPALLPKVDRDTPTLTEMAERMVKRAMKEGYSPVAIEAAVKAAALAAAKAMDEAA